MSISAQAKDPNSNLCRILDAYLPDRSMIAQEWRARLRHAPWSGLSTKAERRPVGLALEMRIGLDLADPPACMNQLWALPSARCSALLEAAGFDVWDPDFGPVGETTDPVIRRWVRVSHPIETASLAQRVGLANCIDAVGWHDIAHKKGHDGWTVDDHRRLYQLLDGRHPTQIDPPSDELTALTHLWQGYLRHGRAAIRDLGERVLASVELVPSFAVIDLVVGRTIIDVKVSASADDQMDAWLNQILGYLLVDRHNVLFADCVGLYLGWQGLLLTVPVAELLSEASRGPTPQLATVRDDCAEALADDIENAAIWRLREQFPTPLS